MGAGGGALLSLSPAIVDIYTKLPEVLSRDECEKLVGKERSNVLWSQYASSVHTNQIEREKLLKLVSSGGIETGGLFHGGVLPQIFMCDFEYFKSNGEFPRHDPQNPWMCKLDDIKTSNSFIVFISHSWLRNTSYSFANANHPDSAGHIHYKLCVEAIDKIRHNHTQNLGACFVWLDYACINQEENPSDDMEQLDTIIHHCDCMLTPIIDTSLVIDQQSMTSAQLAFKQSNSFVHDCFEVNDDVILEKSSGVLNITELRVASWNHYLKRAWTRLEMLCNDAVPLSNGTKFKLLSGNFNLELDYFLSRSCRPHFIFSLQQSREGLNPACMSRIPRTYYERFDPRAGEVSILSDKAKIEELVRNCLHKYNSNDLEGQIGFTESNILEENTVKASETMVFGKYKYVGGDVYEGRLCGDQTLLQHGTGKLISANGDVYDGEWQRGLRHGKGRICYVNGSIYKGEFYCNMRHGIGNFSAAAAGVELWHFNGSWKNDKMNGNGRLVYKSGDCYEGEFHDGAFSGQGILTRADGSAYTGEFKENKKNGFGRMVYSDGKIYEGHWRDNVYHGEGVLECPSGDKYEGNFDMDKFSGFGTFYYENGDVYKGEWRNGSARGQGKFMYADGEVYEGESNNFVKSGFGKYFFGSGSIYEGEWKDDKQHGVGTFMFSNGEVYTGEWVDDMMTGQGSFYMRSGDVYNGGFFNDQRLGFGVMRYADGDVYEGNWDNNAINGEGIFYYTSGSKYEGTWKNGLYHGFGILKNASGSSVRQGEWREGIFFGSERNTELQYDTINGDTDAVRDTSRMLIHQTRLKN